jgi:hypothetical protein
LSINIVYDGKSIGAKGDDSIRNITGTAGTVINTGFSGAFFSGPNVGSIEVGAYYMTNEMLFDASRVVPTSGENTPVWIAVYVCIRY